MRVHFHETSHHAKFRENKILAKISKFRVLKPCVTRLNNSLQRIMPSQLYKDLVGVYDWVGIVLG